MKNGMFFKLMGSLLLMCLAFNLSAQREAGDVGIGIQVGQPSGLSIQVYRPTGASLDFLAAWDLNDFFFLNVHGIFSNHIGNSQNLHFFYGPGAFVGIRDKEVVKDDFNAGISGTIGLSLLIQKLELYLSVTPRLALIESTEADIGGGLGIRFYL